MKKVKRRTIEVWADWVGMPQPLLMGYLYAAAGRDSDIFSFSYHSSWLKSAFAQALDPSLQLFDGEQYAPQGQRNFNIFLDSAPDRWGRVLMDRRESLQAREESRPKRVLHESDYLLGVFDQHRMGALRFRNDPNGPFQDDDPTFASPPWTSLSELEQASLHLEADGAESDEKYKSWLTTLWKPGASLGGARPKASVVDERNALWIAKFPSQRDKYDVAAWEMIVHRLAEKVGITVAPAQARTFGSQHHTFLTKRFDRTPLRERVHFASALTLLQRSDGEDGQSDGASYLELAQFIMQHGANTESDLAELWRRIVFSICVSNTDDHLRNHGFLLTPQGWILSPAYDINPNPNSNGLLLNISETDNAQELDLALEVAKFFRISSEGAKEQIKKVTTIVKQWREEAKFLQISRSEQDYMERAFRIANNFSI